MKRWRLVPCYVTLLLCSTLLLLLLHQSCFLDQYIVLPTSLIPHYSRTNILKETSCTTHTPDNVTKKFLYLIMTESCVPRELLESDVLGSSSACQCDLLVLGYKNKCEMPSNSSHVTHIFAPSTTWTTGRALLYNVTMESKQKYWYYVFMDDDIKLEFFSEVDNINRNPWRAFEDFLLRLQPPIAAIDTEEWESVNRIFRFRSRNGCYKEPLPEYVPAVMFDGMMNAFSHSAMSNVLKPVLPVWSRFDNVSWWYSQWYVSLMSEIVYTHHVILPVELIGRNRQHRSYPRKFEIAEIVGQIIKDVQRIIPLDKSEKSSNLLKKWETGLLRIRMSGYYDVCVTLNSHVCVY